MATTTIYQIEREITGTTDLNLTNGYLEGQDSTGLNGSYKVSLSVVENKILGDLTGTTYDSSLSSGVTVPFDIGGIPSGTTVGELTGKTFSEVFDELLFPTINPTFVNPYNTFSTPVSNLFFVGQLVSPITFTIAYNAGSIILDGVVQNNRAGLPKTSNGYNYTGTGLLSLTSSNTQSLTGYTILSGVQCWTGSVNYQQGPQPLDNKGNPYGTPLSSGTTNPATVSIVGAYPLFATTISITGVSAQSLIPMSTNPAPNNTTGLLLVAESGGNKQTFDVPNAWASGGGVQGIKSYDTNTNQWTYEGSSTQAYSLTFWTQSSVTHTIEGNTVNYKEFVYNGLDRGPMAIYLEF